jgi:hypothetical protein
MAQPTRPQHEGPGTRKSFPDAPGTTPVAGGVTYKPTFCAIDNKARAAKGTPYCIGHLRARGEA